MNDVVCADCLDLLGGLGEASVHAVVTDPPYGLEFMGKEWDTFKRDNSWNKRGEKWHEKHGGTAYGRILDRTPAKWEAGVPFQKWCSLWGRACLRVLKPGGFLLAFGGTRTHHRLVCGLEDAGFKIRDELMWGYASGFPKAQALDKLIDKKLGREGEREVTKPNPHFCEGRKKTFGVHGIYGECEQPLKNLTAPASDEAKEWVGWKTPALKPAWEPICLAQKPCEGSITENVLEHGVGGFNVDACRIPYENEDDYAACDEKQKSFHGAKTIGTIQKGCTTFLAGNIQQNAPQASDFEAGRFPSNLVLTDAILDEGYNKFFLVPKASKSEKEAGLKAFEERKKDTMNSFGEQTGVPQGDGANRTGDKGSSLSKNIHPTVKPLALMEHLIKLVTREGQTVCDPFCGSGSTLVAAKGLGRNFVGGDQSEEYCGIARARLATVTGYQTSLEATY